MLRPAPYVKPTPDGPIRQFEGRPSESWNDPFSMTPPHSERPESMGIEQQGFPISALDPHSVLQGVRANFPFLPIMPLPSETKTIFLGTAGVAVDMILPDGAAICMLRGNQNYLMSLHGNAQVPTAANTGQGDQDPAAVKVFFAPEGVPWFVHGIRSISFVSDIANTYVTALFWPVSLVNAG